MTVLVADSTQVTMSDDAIKALANAAGEWSTKPVQLQVQTVFYTANNETESFNAGISASTLISDDYHAIRVPLLQKEQMRDEMKKSRDPINSFRANLQTENLYKSTI
jgi:hypothetical protein